MTSQEHGDHDSDEPDRGSGVISTVGDLPDEPWESNRCTFGQTARMATGSEEMDQSFFDFEFTKGMVENEYDIDDERILIEGPADNFASHNFSAHRPLTLASFRRLPAVVQGSLEPGRSFSPTGQGQPADAGRVLNQFTRVVAGPHSLLRNLQRLQRDDNNAVADQNRDGSRDLTAMSQSLDEYWVTERGGMYRTEEDEQREITRGPSPDNDQLSGEYSAGSTPRMTTEAPTVCTTFRDHTFRESLTSSIKGLASGRTSGRYCSEGDCGKDGSGKDGSGGSKRTSNRSAYNQLRDLTARSLAQVEPQDDVVMDLTMPIHCPAGRRRHSLARHLAHRQNVAAAAAAEQFLQPQQQQK